MRSIREFIKDANITDIDLNKALLIIDKTQTSGKRWPLPEQLGNIMRIVEGDLKERSKTMPLSVRPDLMCQALRIATSDTPEQEILRICVISEISHRIPLETMSKKDLEHVSKIDIIGASETIKRSSRIPCLRGASISGSRISVSIKTRSTTESRSFNLTDADMNACIGLGLEWSSMCYELWIQNEHLIHSEMIELISEDITDRVINNMSRRWSQSEVDAICFISEKNGYPVNKWSKKQEKPVIAIAKMALDRAGFEGEKDLVWAPIEIGGVILAYKFGGDDGVKNYIDALMKTKKYIDMQETSDCEK